MREEKEEETWWEIEWVLLAFVQEEGREEEKEKEKEEEVEEVRREDVRGEEVRSAGRWRLSPVEMEILIVGSSPEAQLCSEREGVTTIPPVTVAGSVVVDVFDVADVVLVLGGDAVPQTVVFVAVFAVFVVVVFVVVVFA